MDATALTSVVIDGAPLKLDVADLVLDAIVNESATDITSFDLLVADPGFALLGKGVFAKGATVSLAGLDLRIAEIRTGGDSVEEITVRARSRGAFALQQEAGRAGSDYTSFLRDAAARVGLGFRGQPALTSSPIIPTMERGQFVSTWDEGVTGAGEWGFWLFEAGGTLFFGKPSWLLATTPKTISVGWRGSAGADRDALEIPECIRTDGITSTGQPEASIVSVAVPLERAKAIHPGHVLAFNGIPGFAGRYLITQNVWKPGSVEPARITAATPIDPIVRELADMGSTADVPALPHVELASGVEGPFVGGTLDGLLKAAKAAKQRWPFILEKEKAYGLPAYVLFAVGYKETKLGVAYTTGSVGDHGHGHGVWQLDDRSHTIPAGFDTDVNAQCDKAAAMLRDHLQRRNGNLVEALNIYNSGQTNSAYTTGNYGPDVAAMRQALENHLAEWS